VINQWALLDALGAGIPPPAADTFPVMMRESGAARAAVGRRLAEAGVTAADRIVVMHVSAGNPFRRWPVSSFADVAARIVANHNDRRVIVTSGPSEQSAAAHVIAQARERLVDADARARIVACGEFSLAELRALVDRASLYIGGDSGPMHVASTSSVPIVALYGPTTPDRSAPWRAQSTLSVAVEIHGLSCRPCDQRRCEPGDFRCLTRIEPSQVADASERLLSTAAVQ
jgi:ADP-heptose:LPS heptosyltransferase